MLPLALWTLFCLQSVCGLEDEAGHPPMKYLDKLSWRKQPSEYSLSGYASKLPSTQDFLRLVPDQPLAFGAAFSEQTMPSKEWVIDVAFRIHSDAESSQHKSGGRGFGIWYTKTANPTDVTVNAKGQPKASLPPLFPLPELDSAVSLFGQKAPFEGLGIIFDSSPSVPLQKRSDNATYHRHAADDIGVVAGIMDDASGDWLESAVITPGKEANYLKNAIGDCAAKYRNSNGLIWARVSHYDHKISLHLDMSPHSTLSMSERQFRNPCFTIEGVALPTGYHIGLTGLASANPVPDNIDIYAVEVWEVLPRGKTDEYEERLQTDAQSNEVPLQGTEEPDVADTRIFQAVIQSQSDILERLDALTRKVDQLQNAISHVSPGSGTTSQPAAPASGNKLDEQYLVQQIQKVAGQVQTLHHLVDNFQSKTSGTLSIVTSRMGETFGLLHRTSEQLLSANVAGKTSLFSVAIYFSLAALVGVVGLAVYRVTNRGGFGKGKKMI